jgi:DNA-binding FadR family transcriptional regulator
MFEPVENRRQPDAVAQRIAEAILDGTLGVGDRLPPERTLAWELNVSRPTLREGVHVLVAAGVLVVRPGAGGTVVHSDDVPLSLALPARGIGVGEVAGVLQARRLLEPPIAQLATKYARDDDFAFLQRTIDAMHDNPDSQERFQALDMRFHIGIARAIGNTTLLRLAKQLTATLWAARTLLPTYGLETPDFTIDIHTRTLAALMSRNPATVAAVMDEHLSHLEQAWQREIGRAAIDPTPKRTRRSRSPEHAEGHHD